MCTKYHKINVTNFNNSSVCYSVILLKGEITNTDVDCNQHDIIRFQMENNDDCIESQSSVVKSKFKHLIELKLGINVIKIQYCFATVNITINFTPNVRNYYVVPIYIICKNHDGKFQAPADEDNSIGSACERIVLGTKLIQCLLAEKFYEANLTRKTFQIETDFNPKAQNCRVFYSNLTMNEARNMKQEELWCSFGREIMLSEFANEKCKYLAFISCTRYRGEHYNANDIKTYDDIVGLTEAHAALGGGGLAIFGSACLHTWPAHINDVVQSFQNQTRIDKHQFMDDSCYRGTYGGCFATTLGSACHELCHTFDLGHTTQGIMSRGFDEIDKEFIVSNSSSEGKSKVYKVLPIEKQHCTVDFTPNIHVQMLHQSNLNKTNQIEIKTRFEKKIINKNTNGIYWTKSCLLLLYYHRWLNNESATLQHNLKFEDDIILSSAGICVIEIRIELTGLVIKYWEFVSKPIHQFRIEKNQLINDRNQSLVLVVEDVCGNLLKTKLIV